MESETRELSDALTNAKVSKKTAIASLRNEVTRLQTRLTKASATGQKTEGEF